MILFHQSQIHICWYLIVFFSEKIQAEQRRPTPKIDFCSTTQKDFFAKGFVPCTPETTQVNVCIQFILHMCMQVHEQWWDLISCESKTICVLFSYSKCLKQKNSTSVLGTVWRLCPICYTCFMCGWCLLHLYKQVFSLMMTCQFQMNIECTTDYDNNNKLK